MFHKARSTFRHSNQRKITAVNTFYYFLHLLTILKLQLLGVDYTNFISSGCFVVSFEVEIYREHQ